MHLCDKTKPKGEGGPGAGPGGVNPRNYACARPNEARAGIFFLLAPPCSSEPK